MIHAFGYTHETACDLSASIWVSVCTQQHILVCLGVSECVCVSGCLYVHTNIPLVCLEVSECVRLCLRWVGLFIWTCT